MRRAQRTGRIWETTKEIQREQRECGVRSAPGNKMKLLRNVKGTIGKCWARSAPGNFYEQIDAIYTVNHCRSFKTRENRIR